MIPRDMINADDLQIEGTTLYIYFVIRKEELDRDEWEFEIRMPVKCCDEFIGLLPSLDPYCNDCRDKCPYCSKEIKFVQVKNFNFLKKKVN